MSGAWKAEFRKPELLNFAQALKLNRLNNYLILNYNTLSRSKSSALWARLMGMLFLSIMMALSSI